MITGGSFLPALPITTTTKRKKKKMILTSQRHLGDILIPATNICNFFYKASHSVLRFLYPGFILSHRESPRGSWVKINTSKKT